MQSKIEEFKARLKAGVKVHTVPLLYPTPKPVAARAVELLDLDQSVIRILEPSAGLGSLIESLPPGPIITAIEVNQSLADALEKRFPAFTVFCCDFLLFFTGHKYDRIIMNPPFNDGADIKHVNHALTLLKPGGVLVAIIAGGPRQERAFKAIASHWEHLPPGTFEGTNVNAVLMRIRS